MHSILMIERILARFVILPPYNHKVALYSLFTHPESSPVAIIIILKLGHTLELSLSQVRPFFSKQSKVPHPLSVQLISTILRKVPIRGLIRTANCYSGENKQVVPFLRLHHNYG